MSEEMSEELHCILVINHSSVQIKISMQFKQTMLLLLKMNKR